MSEHEFYADPTVFDLWQEQTGGWFSGHGARLQPYAWSLAFIGSAAILLGIGCGVLGCSVVQRLDGGLQPPWSQSVAQWLTVLIALPAAQALLQQSLLAWPAGRRMPERLRVAFHRCGFSVPAVSRPAGPDAAGAPVSVVFASAGDREAKTFFAGVREAGINVTSAKALFSAGIRSAQQLHEATDGQLLQIHGVGPATVRRLRARFG
ncbi:MAG: helix-hairpin-helix domain-containing protein [Gammaproteobacteria bacterium]|jgi:hypothetical protein